MAIEDQDAGARNEGFFAAAGALLESVRSTVNAVVEPVTEPLMRDGTLAAAWRQGVDEIWQALMPLPDTIQAVEPGTINEPTQGEIAESRRPDPAPAMTPGEIAASNLPREPELDAGKDLGQSL